MSRGAGRVVALGKVDRAGHDRVELTLTVEPEPCSHLRFRAVEDVVVDVAVHSLDIRRVVPRRLPHAPGLPRRYDPWRLSLDVLALAVVGDPKAIRVVDE